MKDVRINNLYCKDFRATKVRTIDLGGRSVSIVGENGIGKTTIADLAYWIFTGKDSLNEATFDIKEKDPATLRAIPNVNHIGELEITIDGQPFELRKDYFEVWGEERGIPVTSPKSHKTAYSRNGVGCTETEFNEWLKTIASPEAMRLLMDPYYFTGDGPKGYGKDKRRELLLQICGDVSLEDVIASSKDLAELPALLGRYSIADFLRVKTDERKNARQERDGIRPRIDEQTTILNRATPDAAADLAELRAELQNFVDVRARITGGGELANKKLELAQLQTTAQDISNAAQAALGTAHADALAEVRRAEGALGDAENARLVIERNRAADLVAIEQLDKELEVLRSALEVARGQRQAKKEEQFAFAGADTCPVCTRPLPVDAVQLAVETARGNFNEAKAKWLESDALVGAQRVAAIKAKETLKASIQVKADTKLAEIETAQTAIGEATKIRDAARAKAAGLEAPVLNLDVNPDYQANQKSQAAVRVEIETLSNSNAGVLAQVDAEISAVNLKITAATEAAALAGQQAQARAAIARHEAREKELSKQIDEIDRGVKLCENFTRAKVRLLTDRINAKFQFTRWVLFEDQINGGLKEVCEATYLGVPPSEGFALDVGLDCINVLAEHFGVSMPIIIDRAEKRTTYLPTLGQQIRCVVRKGVTDLTLEFDEEPAKSEDLELVSA